MFTIQINTDGAAFRDEDGHLDMFGFEVKRLLRKVTTSIDCGCKEGVLIDSNGNKVGFYKYKD